LLYFVINLKNYSQVGGYRAVRFARAANEASKESEFKRKGIELVLALPAFSIGIIAKQFPRLTIYAQHLDVEMEGSSTGFLVPEIAKSFGAKGSILNHSEHRLSQEILAKSVLRLKQLGMRSIVCAKDASEVGKIAELSPDYIAIEPPELIGSGNAVSKSRPEVVTDSKISLDNARPRGSNTILLCGAGIVESLDAQRSIELGAEGILVASGVVKAANWKKKIESLAEGLNAAGKKRARPKEKR
jgi:triosephosphate isomerase